MLLFFRSIWEIKVTCSFFHIPVMSHTVPVNLESPWPHLKSTSPSFLLPIPTLSSNCKLLCLEPYLSIKRRMKCEQSEKCQATDTQLQQMQLCQWQIIFWPLSLGLYGWRFATVTDAFCFRALYSSVTAAEPALKCWGAHLFERQLDFFCCSFSFTLYLLLLYVSLSGTFSLFISLSATTSVLCPSLYLLFCVSVYYLYF